MPEKRTLERARQAKRSGKSPSTQAGAFVREEMEHIRKGKHGAKSSKQAIAIGLSKARRSGVKLKSPKTATSKTRKSVKSAKTRAGKPVSKTRSTARKAALKKAPRRAASHSAISRQAHRTAKSRSSASRSAAAKKAARTRARNKAAKA